MHRLIMNVDDPSLLIDHINHNTLDNRLINLRIVDYNKNSWNSKTSNRNTSGVKGVNFDVNHQKWRARISYNGKRYELGYYDTLDEAMEARKKAEEKYYAEYNFKDDE